MATFGSASVFLKSVLQKKGRTEKRTSPLLEMVYVLTAKEKKEETTKSILVKTSLLS